MNDTRYLFQRNGIWWVKIAVPCGQRDALGYDIRRSLQTRDIHKAIAKRDAVVDELRRMISDAAEVRVFCSACQCG